MSFTSLIDIKCLQNLSYTRDLSIYNLYTSNKQWFINSILSLLMSSFKYISMFHYLRTITIDFNEIRICGSQVTALKSMNI